MMTTRLALCLLALLVAASPALAQRGKGKGRGRDRQDEERIRWVENFETAKTEALSNRRGIIIYVQPADEISPPAAFNIQQAIDASHDMTVFHKVRFHEEDTLIRQLKIDRAPLLLAYDYHMNLYGIWPGAPGTTRLIDVIKGLPNWMAGTRAKLRNVMSNVSKLRDQGDEAGAIRALGSLLQLGLKGYPDIDRARRTLKGIADARFKKIKESAAKAKQKDVINAWRGAARDFAGSPVACEAEMELARYLLGQGDVQAAVKQVQRSQRAHAKTFPDESEKAAGLLYEIGQQGIGEIRKLLAAGIEGDPGPTRDAIQALRKAYTGTAASEHAAAVLKDLSP